MDMWKFYDVTHRDHIMCNPTSLNKMDTLIDVLKLGKGKRVLDIATGKGEFLFRLAERYGVSGVGVDLSPYHIQEAREKLSQRKKSLDIELIEIDGAKYKPDDGEKFDLVSCLGASWIYKGYKGTLTALRAMVKSSGFIVVGEPFWIADPPQPYLEIIECKHEDFGSHVENVETAESMGLNCIYTVVSDINDWDYYETVQWNAAYNYIRENSDDPDCEEIANKSTETKYAYLKYGRDCLGWAIYVFRN